MEAATWDWRDWVCSNLGVTEEQVLGVYTIGSQAFGTATPSSGTLTSLSSPPCDLTLLKTR